MVINAAVKHKLCWELQPKQVHSFSYLLEVRRLVCAYWKNQLGFWNLLLLAFLSFLFLVEYFMLVATGSLWSSRRVLFNFQILLNFCCVWIMLLASGGLHWDLVVIMPPVIGLSYMALKVNAKMCKVMYVQVLLFSSHNCHAFWIKD